MLLELSEGFMDRGFERFNVAKKVIVQGRSFEIPPQPLNQIQLRTVTRQPCNQHMVTMLLQKFQNSVRPMVAGIVQDKNYVPIRVGLQQLPQELVELLGIFLGMHHVVALAGAIVESSIYAQSLVGACSRDEWTNASQRPHFRQGRVEVNFTLIEVEQVEGCV